MAKKAVVLASGGIDSSTVLAICLEQGYEVHALSFDYAQRNKPELEMLKKQLQKLPIKSHKIINIDLRAFGGSALTDNDISVPKYESASDLGDDIPVTYVPARNTIFLSYALAFAEVIGSDDIFIGVHASDYANYPDCRPEYISAFEKMANLATASGVLRSKITIHAPIIHMTKTQIVAEGLKLGVDYTNTISCYDPTPEGLACGTCHSCLIRLKAFSENGVKDPGSYIKN